jgi:hypothetical protein
VHPLHPYQAEKLASQHRSDLYAVSERCEHARVSRQARQSGHATAGQGGRHVIRRRAGWALVSLGLRLAYAAGED